MEIDFKITIEKREITKKEKIIALISLFVLIGGIYYKIRKKQG
ncbi:hypothetical protein [Staphylococcus petrasii]|nr:hypothetical protein [Staphylococcus petrasii]SUM60167.1 Uncharacterised protein [Staphylococcus petrasii]